MSGGVDSAVAAARAVDAGHDVTGVHLALSAGPGDAAHRRPRLLHARGRQRRPPGRRRARHPVLRLGPRRAVPRRRHRRLRRRVRRRSHTEPVPALQREDQVLGGARPRGGPRLRRGGHRPPRPAGRRPAEPFGRPGQGPVLRPGRADPAAAAPGDLPARRLHQGAGARRGRAPAASRVADKPDSHDICFIADGDTRGFLARRLGVQDGPDRRRRHRRDRGRPPRAPTASPSASGEA